MFYSFHSVFLSKGKTIRGKTTNRKTCLMTPWDIWFFFSSRYVILVTDHRGKRKVKIIAVKMIQLQKNRYALLAFISSLIISHRWNS